jgi:hypothetical protein
MSQDLILRTVKKNWARGGLEDLSYTPISVSSPETPKVVPTPEERARLGKLATLRARAESGDARSQKEWRVTLTKVAALRVRARGGDPKAVRACQVLEQSGIFGKSRKSASNGDAPNTLSGEVVGRQEIMGREELLGEFVGDEERLSRDAGSAERDATSRVCGTFPNFARNRKHHQRGRRLRKLVWRSARGDASATSRLQQVTSRLQQRSSAGDARATALLREVQDMRSRAQARVASQTATSPAAALTPTAPPPGAPPAAAPPIEVTYAAPAADYGDEYDE